MQQPCCCSACSCSRWRTAQQLAVLSSAAACLTWKRSLVSLSYSMPQLGLLKSVVPTVPVSFCLSALHHHLGHVGEVLLLLKTLYTQQMGRDLQRFPA